MTTIHTQEAHRNRLARIVKAAADVFFVSEHAIMSNWRATYATKPRFAVYYALRCEGLTYERIGDLMRRNHATVLIGVRRASELIQADPEYAAACDALLNAN